MIKLNKRLNAIANIVLIGNSKKIIDVGCDHALLDIYLVQNNDNIKVIASDINQYPLDNARKNIERYSFLDKIELCLKNGIENIDETIDTVVISGMGCETIIEILKKGKKELEHIERLIISSNNKYEKLRRDIISLGFFINNEEIILEDGKYYVIMELLKGKRKYNDKELFFGPILLKNKNDNFYSYYNYFYNTLCEILNSLPDNHPKRKQIDKEIKLLKEELQK